MVLMWMQKQEFMLFLCLFVLCEIMLLPHDDHVWNKNVTTSKCIASACGQLWELTIFGCLLCFNQQTHYCVKLQCIRAWLLTFSFPSCVTNIILVFFHLISGICAAIFDDCRYRNTLNHSYCRITGKCDPVCSALWTSAEWNHISTVLEESWIFHAYCWQSISFFYILSCWFLNIYVCVPCCAPLLRRWSFFILVEMCSSAFTVSTLT